MKLSIATLFLVCFSNLFAQDSTYTKKIIETLCSKKMAGRGYVNKGDQFASNFISKEFKSIGLKSFGNDYFQEFDFSVNTFPGEIELLYNGKRLVPGESWPSSHRRGLRCHGSRCGCQPGCRPSRRRSW